LPIGRGRICVYLDNGSENGMTSLADDDLDRIEKHCRVGGEECDDLRGRLALAEAADAIKQLRGDVASLKAALTEACDEYEYAAQYKGDYLTKKHCDAETLERLRAIAREVPR
jgi:hypothetical protein